MKMMAWKRMGKGPQQIKHAGIWTLQSRWSRGNGLTRAKKAWKCLEKEANGEHSTPCRFPEGQRNWWHKVCLKMSVEQGRKEPSSPPSLPSSGTRWKENQMGFPESSKKHEGNPQHRRRGGTGPFFPGDLDHPGKQDIQTPTPGHPSVSTSIPIGLSSRHSGRQSLKRLFTASLLNMTLHPLDKNREHENTNRTKRTGLLSPGRQLLCRPRAPRSPGEDTGIHWGASRKNEWGWKIIWRVDRLDRRITVLLENFAVN